MTPEQLKARLEERPLLLDGGLGSMLISMGLQGGEPPELWLFEHPERIEDVHRRYAEAGSDAITTCTFGASPAKLATDGMAKRCGELNRRAAELARRAAGPGRIVAGNIGPTGLLLPPVGQATPEQLVESFSEQAAALAAAGVDALLVETMYDLREAVAAVRVASATGLAVLATMTYSARKRGFFTVMGDPLVASLQALREAGATAVGFNCTVTSDVMLRMVDEAARALPVPLMAQPNAGQPRPTKDGIVYDASPDGFATDLARMVGAGARIVGGCCGTDPDFIRRTRAALDRRDGGAR